jgi:hypothetical protein
MKRAFIFMSIIFVYHTRATDAPSITQEPPPAVSLEQNTSPSTTKPFMDRIQSTYTTIKEYVSKKVQMVSDTLFKKDEKAPRVIIIRNHTRLKRWMFNRNFRKDKSQKDILYHTFHPIANYFIEQYGKQKEYIAGNFRGMQYSLKGVIEYPDGKQEPVIFTITKNKNGSWYHRGIMFLTKPLLRVPKGPFTPRMMHYKFGNNGLVREIVCFESSSWIKIYDVDNDVTLYLKKNNFL